MYICEAIHLFVSLSSKSLKQSI